MKQEASSTSYNYSTLGRLDGKPQPSYKYRSMEVHGQGVSSNEAAEDMDLRSGFVQGQSTTEHAHHQRRMSIVRDNMECDVHQHVVSGKRTGAIMQAVCAPILDGLTLVMHGRLLGTLIDTGAMTSVINDSQVQDMDLSVDDAAGVIKLAVNGMTVPRRGTTEVEFTALFPLRVQGKSLPSRDLKWRFEVANLGTNDYQVIIGMDLLPVLFGTDSLPMVYISGHDRMQVPVVNSTQVDQQVDAQVEVQAEMHEPVTVNAILPILQQEYTSEGDGPSGAVLRHRTFIRSGVQRIIER